MNNKSLYRFKAAAALVGVSALATGFLAFAPMASADVSPAGCLNNDFQITLNKSVALAYDQTNPNGPTGIIYSVSVGNPQLGNGCDVTDVSITVTDPHGTVHTIQTGGSYPIGTAIATLSTTTPYTANSADEATSTLTASVHAIGTLHDSANNDALDITKSVSLTVIHPNTVVSITPSATSTSSGGVVNLTITEDNTGDTPISSTTVTLTPPGTVLNRLSASFTGGDATDTGILDAGETWTWVVTSTVSSATTYTAVGDGFDLLGNHVTSPTYPTETASTSVSIVDANISITPNGTNEIGHTHTFTGHVNVNSGSGFVNAPDGTIINFGIFTGPGALSAPSCATASGTGSCTVNDTSAVPGIDIVDASTTVLVNGVTLSRSTNGSNGNSGPATKTWVDANIQITPATSTNPVGAQHVLTGHVNVNTGTGGYVSAPSGTVVTFGIASGPGTLSAPSCMTIGSTGSCTDTLTSTSTGTTVVNASTSVVVGGVTLNRTTNGTAGNSGPANKTWIQSGITTLLSATTTSVGSPVHDSATLTGTTGTAGGTVTYSVFAGTSCSGTPVFTSTSSVVNGIAGDSANFTPLSAGTYNWQAAYSGDVNNTPATSTCETEVLTVNGFTPSITTTLSSTTVNVGTPVHDSATLTGASSNAGGTVTYNIFAGLSCSGTPIASSTETVASGTVPDSANFTPTASGTFNWQAIYSGDINNASATSACQTETLTVNVNRPSITTTLSTTTVNVNNPVTDSATLTGATSDASGMVTYNVYAGTSCTGSPVFTSTSSVIGGIAGISASFMPTASGTFNWQAVYSGDSKNASAISACGTETLTVVQPQILACSPGFWKNHTLNWPAPYTPGTTFDSAFSDNAFPSSTTLLQVLQTGGGGVNAAGRQAVNALLDSIALAPNYPLSTSQVIADFNAALAGGNFDSFTSQIEGFGDNCPLGGKANPNPGVSSNSNSASSQSSTDNQSSDNSSGNSNNGHSDHGQSVSALASSNGQENRNSHGNQDNQGKNGQ